MKNLVFICVGQDQLSDQKLAENFLENSLHYNSLKMNIYWLTAKDAVSAFRLHQASSDTAANLLIFVTDNHNIASSLRVMLPRSIIFAWTGKREPFEGVANEILNPYQDTSDFFLAVFQQVQSAS